jgi:hypothetical protein
MEQRQGVLPSKMMRFKMLLAVVGATAMLALQASAAYAQSGSEGYSGPNVVSGFDQGGPSQPAGQVAPAQAEIAPTAQTAAPEQAAALEQTAAPEQTATPADSAAPEQTAAAADTGALNETAAAATAAVQTPVDEAGTLPFTGTDLGVVTAAAGLLLALGFGLRRLTHRPTP